MSDAAFVVLEGGDGVGTTTHTKRLFDSLRRSGRAVHATREPSDGPIGVQIRQILSGRLVVPGPTGPRAPDWRTMALLFAADRMDHNDATILPQCGEGTVVLSDRYYHSSVAYQSITGGGAQATVDWVKEINRHARRPALTLVLDVPDEVSERRRIERRGGRELYDDRGLQSQLAAFYRSMGAHFPGERIVWIDAHRPVEEVAREILEETLRVVGA